MSDQDLRQNLDTFLQGPYATKGGKEILMRYLTFSTQYQEPVLIPPENDILIKLDLIDHIRNDYLESPDAKDFEFTSLSELPRSKYRYIASLLLERTTSEQLESLLSEEESPDISWNAITLSKDVHFQLGRGLLALKPMACKFDEGRLEVSFQVYWLPENCGRDPKAPVKPDMEAVRHIPKPLSEPEALEQVIESSRYNHQPIVTGDVIYITMLSREDAMNMVLALELRWAVCMVMFMAGAAGLSNDELDAYETEDEDQIINIPDGGYYLQMIRERMIR
ncbi:hypothetical protein K4F52_009636 [Lecanicillium sp. MT-2017a]|nr:hypothetical protein K4F52_009636 [Lecanicillium sp. MT-2017a]